MKGIIKEIRFAVAYPIYLVSIILSLLATLIDEGYAEFSKAVKEIFDDRA